MERILVTGAFGLVGSDLVPNLQKKYGMEAIVAMAHHNSLSSFEGIIEYGDVLNKNDLSAIVKKYNISQIYHLSGILSAGGEKNPSLAWEVNVNGLRYILELAVEHKLRIFWPSSIAVFGPTTPKVNTPQHTILEPTTMYGINKATGELLCQYYHQKYGLDVRSLRYPGLIGYKAEPGDGTTEYAISIFYAALKGEKYTCFLREGTVLPMMYMDDAIKGTIDLMEESNGSITIRTSYNFSAISFAPEDIYQEIVKYIPEFKIVYKPDIRQKTADSWPQSINDSVARQDWGWQPAFDLEAMVKDMLAHLRKV